MILTIDKTHELKGNGYLLGVAAENESEQLIINIAFDALLTKWVYIEFEQKEKHTTERLAIENGRVVYNIPNGLLKQGHVRVQVIFRDASGFVWKSFVRQFAVDASINAGSNLPEEHPDFITEAQKLLDKITVESEKVDEVLTTEEERKAAELVREQNEATRQESETVRELTEIERKTAERLRQTAEIERQTNEAGRVDAETARRTEFSGWQDSLGNLNTYDKRLINLEEAGVGSLFDYQTDDTTAYIKTVPAKALPYARLNKVGGSVTSIKGSGINRFNLSLGTYTTRGITLKKGGNSSYIINGTTTETVDIYIGAQSGSYFNEKDQAVITDINTVNSLYTLTNNGGFENYALVGGVYQRNTFEITDTNKANTIFVRIPSGKTFNDFELKIMLNRGSAIEFRPYAQIDYSIPDAIKALDGYGAEGSNIDFERKLFVNGETTTDISAYITDNYIKVEANGTIIFENDNAQAVPSEIVYAVRRG